MPYTPERINKQIENVEASEIKKGEEGILYPITLDGESYYAKSWRGKHFENAPAVAYHEEANKTPTSPFWFKVKYYESLLIHEAFPNHTLKVHIGYDPRISKDGEFDYSKGRPVTVTTQVPRDTPKGKIRDEIIDKTYERYMAHTYADKKGILSAHPRTSRITFEADEAMQHLIGEELHVGGFNWQSPHESLHALRRKAVEINPDSIVVDFITSGIIPVHPEFNFIPTENDNKYKTPHGVFLELAIVEPEWLKMKLLSRDSSPEYKEKVTRLVDRYVFLRSLDQMYDNLFYFQHVPALLEIYKSVDVEIVNYVYQILEKVRQRYDTEENNQRNLLLMLPKLERSLMKILRLYPNKEELMEQLRIVEDGIINKQDFN